MKIYEINLSYKIHNLYGFSEPASQKMEILIEMYHNTVVSLSYILFAIIFAIVVTVRCYRRHRNIYLIPLNKSGENIVDALFVLVTIIIVCYVALPALEFIVDSDKLIAYLDTPITLEVVEYQWYWSYGIYGEESNYLMDLFKLMPEVNVEEESEVTPDGMLMMNAKNSAWKYLPSSDVRTGVSYLNPSDVPQVSKIAKVLSNHDKFLEGSVNHYSLSFDYNTGVFSSGKIPKVYEQVNLGTPPLCPVFKYKICKIETVRDTLDYNEILHANSSKVLCQEQKMVIYKSDQSKYIYLKTAENDQFLKELLMREYLMEEDFLELKYKLLSRDPLCKDELARAKYDSYISNLSFKELNELWWKYNSGDKSNTMLDDLASKVSKTEIVEVPKDTYLFSRSIVKDFMKMVKQK